jgi:hypothetical protein
MSSSASRPFWLNPKAARSSGFWINPQGFNA